jgi:phosphatidylethanolamine/phosphatidyl-N-methylethanolamine N-methyltransferase
MPFPNFNPLHKRINNRSVFFQEFVKYPLQIGSIIPSSRFLEQHVVKAAGVCTAKIIVELGPGIGGMTRAILHAMDHHAKLLSIEINPNFHAFLNCIEDDRLIAHLGNAHELKDIIYKYGLNKADVVISGIPFSTMSHTFGSHLIETILSILSPRGRFIAYQLSKRISFLCQPLLGPGHVEIELLNIPPMRVYRWEKNNA